MDEVGDVAEVETGQEFEYGNGSEEEVENNAVAEDEMEVGCEGGVAWDGSLEVRDLRIGKLAVERGRVLETEHVVGTGVVDGGGTADELDGVDEDVAVNALHWDAVARTVAQARVTVGAVVVVGAVVDDDGGGDDDGRL